MRKKRIIILGAGISGLSCAWYLSKLSHLCEFIVLEKMQRPGGYLQTENQNGFLFEKGPRTFKTSRSAELLELAHELGLKNELIESDGSAAKRYLWLNQKMQKLPGPLFSFSLFKEWFVAAKTKEEETIYEFAVRRFNKKLAERFFDPLATGVYAGDIRSLSMNSCFPYFKMLEEKYGSVIKGFLKERFKNKKPESSLFSFHGGVQTLIHALSQKLKDHLHFGEEVTKIRFNKNKAEVQTKSGLLEADLVICALPAEALGRIFYSTDREIGSLLQSIKLQGLISLNLGFKDAVLPFKGFGYLVPSSQQQQIYGAVFDSAIFPQQNQAPNETRITAMVKENTDIQTALSEIKKHLKIFVLPDFVKSLVFKNAIPQFELGHRKKIQLLKQKMLEKYSACRLLGNYLKGVSVNDCIANSSELVLNLQQELLSRP
ncbi:MAG TPA: protoporphyrinogen oxidase [Rhabdochlamydiaceae bacterium]|nr:protoporphyrinogen oxidase [Rhabdochlamydiaceae bacterium]